MIFRKLRTARKVWWCDCSKMIKPGEKYLEFVATPDHGDLGNSVWWKIQECQNCATRYGRGEYFV